MLIDEVQDLASRLHPRGGGKTMAAKIAGVSLPTFSHAIGGKYVVSQKTLERIRDAVITVLIDEKIRDGFSKGEVILLAEMSEAKLRCKVKDMLFS